MLLAVYIIAALLVFCGYKKWQQQSWGGRSPGGAERETPEGTPEGTLGGNEDPALRHRMRDDWHLVPLELV